MLKYIACLGVSLVVLAGCSGGPKVGDAPVAGPDFSAEEYRIGVGDRLSVSVWRDQELSKTVPVRPDGKISMPLVGDVQAAGLTSAELSSNLSKSLSNYVRSPQVTVIVDDPVSTDFQQRVRVTGAVGQATSVAYRKGMTVLDLVLLAGGANRFADGNNTQLYRHTAEGVKVYPVRLDDILNKGKLETNYPLLPSDILTVPERMF